LEGFLKMDKAQKSIDPKSLGKVVLLLGGRSSEREVSLMSGKGVFDALQGAGVDVTRFDPQEQPLSELEKGDYDRAVISLHGRFGEDGTIQGVLEYLNIPYTGPGVRASAIAIDKNLTKLVWRERQIPTPNGMLVTKDSDMSFVIQELGVNLVVKPSREGSSIGLTKLEYANVQTLREAVEKASQLDPQVLVEERIYGRELTVAILGEGQDARVLPIIEIVAPDGDYDYQNKYFTDVVRYECPADLSEELRDDISTTCLRAYRALGARGWSRIDVMLAEDGRFVLLEMNTSPGMTAHSLVPLAAKNAGMSYEELVLQVAASASLDTADR
jgi:D-alanine-D-alanine ligase